MKLLIGGSPCTYWSIAQTKNRETEASGMGWELFKNFLIARDKYKPDYFLYENNKSMSPAIRAQITKEFGFEPVMIDSALVSAQSRKRLYWLGRREPDGTYSRVNVELPEDRGIILRDILETGVAFREKAYTLDANYYKTTGTFNPKKQRSYSRHQAAEPINTTENGKSQTIKAQYAKSSTANFCCYTSTYGASGVAEPINTTANEKGFALKAHYGRTGITEMLCGGGYFPASGVAEIVYETADGQIGIFPPQNEETATVLNINPSGNGMNGAVIHIDGKARTLTTNKGEGQKIIEPIRQDETIPLNMTQDGKAQCLRASCWKDGIRNMVGNDKDRRTCCAEPIKIGEVNGGGQGNRVYSINGKSCAITAQGGGQGSNTQLYAEPVRIGTIESAANNKGQDSQQYRVYGPDGKSVTLCGAGGVLVQRPACMQCRSARANACPGNNKTGICGNPARGMRGLVHAAEQDEEGQTNE